MHLHNPRDHGEGKQGGMGFALSTLQSRAAPSSSTVSQSNTYSDSSAEGEGGEELPSQKFLC